MSPQILLSCCKILSTRLLALQCRKTCLLLLQQNFYSKSRHASPPPEFQSDLRLWLYRGLYDRAKNAVKYRNIVSVAHFGIYAGSMSRKHVDVRNVFTTHPHCSQCRPLSFSLSVCPSVRMSVRPSRSGVLSRRMKIRSCGLQCQIVRSF